MSVGDDLLELGGEVLRRVVPQDAVEGDGIMIPDGVPYPDPAELLIQGVQVGEPLPPDAEHRPHHVVLHHLELVKDLLCGGGPQADAVVQLAEAETLGQRLPALEVSILGKQLEHVEPGCEEPHD